MSETTFREPDRLTKDNLRLVVSDLHGERILERPTIYVYEAPVRICHWVNALAIVILMITGYMIGSPPPSGSGEAYDSFFFGYIRFAHFAAGQVLAVFFVLRILWAFVGNAHSRQLYYVPFWSKRYWSEVILELRWYSFLVKYPKRYVGHNPLAQFAMFTGFTVFGAFMIITGFALYAEGQGVDSWQYKVFGWIFTFLPNSQDVHTLHHIGLWAILIFAIVHIYAAIREDIASRQTLLSAIISGERQFRD